VNPGRVSAPGARAAPPPAAPVDPAESTLPDPDDDAPGGTRVLQESRPVQTSARVTASGRQRTPQRLGDGPEEPSITQVDPLIGQTPLGQYKILSKIGEGGFGAVFLADQLGVGRKAVIKVLRQALVGSEDFVKRFEREAAVLAQLENQHLVRLYNFGRLDDGQLFLAMEYGGDTTVADVIKRQGHLEADRALVIAEQICEALEDAHGHGIVHRDLKPQNVLVSRRNTTDWAKVVDVGIAKILDADDGEVPAQHLTGTGVVIGTPAYFSPEQARGLSVDGRSDLYALGIVLYEMLSGTLPIKGISGLDFVRAHAVDPPTPFSRNGIELPPYIEKVVFRALEKNPAKRYQSAEEMRRALVEARARMYSGGGSRGPRKLLYAGVAAAAAAAAVSLAVYLARPALIRLAVAPSNAELLLDGKVVHAGKIKVGPGLHTVRARADGFAPQSRTVDIERGAELALNFALVETPAEEPAREDAAAQPAPDPSQAAAAEPADAQPKDPPKSAADAPRAAPAPTHKRERESADAAASRRDEQALEQLVHARKLEQSGDLAGAIACAQRAAALKPEKQTAAAANLMLGRLHYRKGELMSARMYMNLYLPHCTSDCAEARDLLARINAASK